MKHLAAAGLVAAAGLAGWTSPDAAWSGWASSDPMTDEVRKGVSSQWTAPRRSMGFPYQNTRAVAGLSCDGSGAYFLFTNPPNLTNDDPRDGGYSVSHLRMRFDDDPPRRFTFTQSWGSDQLATGSREVRSALLGKHKAMLEVPWHGEGNVVFEFDLTGSRKTYAVACASEIEAPRRRAEQARRTEEARAWEIEKAKNTAWLLRRILEAGYPCAGIKHAFASRYLPPDRSVTVRCEDGRGGRIDRYKVTEDSVRRTDSGVGGGG